MRRVRLFRSTPFRLALAFGAFFIGAFLVTGLVAYQLMKADLATRLDRSANDTWAVLAATYEGGDLEDLVQVVETYSSLSRPQDRIFLLLDPQGHRLAGNFSARPSSPGLSPFSAKAAGLTGHGDYPFFSVNVDANRLAVGLSFAETHELEGSRRRPAGRWQIVTLISVAGGALLARASSGGWTASPTPWSVSHGRLDARIRWPAMDDDIDAVSGQVNASTRAPCGTGGKRPAGQRRYRPRPQDAAASAQDDDRGSDQGNDDRQTVADALNERARRKRPST